MPTRLELELERSIQDLERSMRGSGTSLGSRTLGGNITDELRANDRRQLSRDLSAGRRQEGGRLGGGGGKPNATTGAHGLYVAAIFLQELASEMKEEWLYELLSNIGRDATQRAQNKLGMYQPPENILGYQFPGWEKLSEKYRTWKMSKVGMESPGIMRGIISGSIDWYVVPQVLEVVVGSSEDYAYWFELGKVDMPPRPFLAPAVLETTADWIRVAAKEGFVDESSISSWAQSGEVVPERFTQGAMAEAINKLREAITAADLPTATKRKFLPAIVERVFPGVEDWRWPTGVPSWEQERLGMKDALTGYMVGEVPARGDWSDYRQYFEMVRQAAHRSPLESLEEVPVEDLYRLRHGDDEPDIEF